jgi:hypothetical protein
MANTETDLHITIISIGIGQQNYQSNSKTPVATLDVWLTEFPNNIPTKVLKVSRYQYQLPFYSMIVMIVIKYSLDSWWWI